MLCDKCGAVADGGAAVCPECGGTLAIAEIAKRAPMTRSPRDRKRPAWLIPAVAAVVLLGIAAAAFLLWPRTPALTGPAGAVQRMLEASAVYDAAGYLDNATHGSLTATDVAAFTKQVENAKAQAKGAPNVKDVKIIATTYDPADKNKAAVELSAQWLTDPVKGTYTTRTDRISVVYKDNKWQVVLFP